MTRGTEPAELPPDKRGTERAELPPEKPGPSDRRVSGGPPGHPGFEATRQRLSPADQRRLSAKSRIVEQARRLIDSLALLDASGAEVADLEILAGDVGDVADRMESHPSHRETGLQNAGTWASALDLRSPISGRHNPLAAPMHVETDGTLTYGHAIFGAAYEGPPGTVHGGFVCAAFDELLGIAQAVSGQAGHTGTLAVKMLRPTPLHTRVDYEAGVDRVEGRKIFMWGRSFANGELLGETTGIFIARRPEVSTT